MPARTAKHDLVTFDSASHKESSISSISSFKPKCPPNKGILLCEEPKISSAPHALPNENEVKGSSSETSRSYS